MRKSTNTPNRVDNSDHYPAIFKFKYRLYFLQNIKKVYILFCNNDLIFRMYLI